MAEEKIFTIPLRDAYEVERVNRAKNASKIVREFLIRHMKADDVKIGKSINEKIWERGAKKPPRRLRIHAIKEGEMVYAELIGFDIKPVTAEEAKKRAEKEKEKKQRIKEERKERRRKTIQEEIKEEEKGKEVVKEEKAE